MKLINFINKQHGRVRLSFAMILLGSLSYQLKDTLNSYEISLLWVLLIAPIVIYYFIRFLLRKDVGKFLLIITSIYIAVILEKVFTLN